MISGRKGRGVCAYGLIVGLGCTTRTSRTMTGRTPCWTGAVPCEVAFEPDREPWCCPSPAYTGIATASANSIAPDLKQGWACMTSSALDNTRPRRCHPPGTRDSDYERRSNGPATAHASCGGWISVKNRSLEPTCSAEEAGLQTRRHQ